MVSLIVGWIMVSGRPAVDPYCGELAGVVDSILFGEEAFAELVLAAAALLNTGVRLRPELDVLELVVSAAIELLEAEKCGREKRWLSEGRPVVGSGALLLSGIGLT